MVEQSVNLYYGWKLNKRKITSYIIKKYKHIVAEKYKKFHLDENDIVIENNSHHLDDFEEYEHIDYGFQQLKFISVICPHSHKKVEYAIIHNTHISHNNNYLIDEFDPEELKNQIPKEDIELLDILGGHGSPKIFFVNGTEKQ
jgi:hypothetical protein